MEITLEKASKPAKITVSLKEEDYQSKVAEKLKEYSKKAQIKGFRPGKVPQGLVKQMYGKSVLIEEVNQLVSTSINEYIKSNKLNIVGDPMPTQENGIADWNNPSNFEFKFNIGLVPDFTVDLSAIKATRNLIQVDEAILTETTDNMRAQLGEMVDVESSEAEDFLFGTFKQKDGEYVKENTMFPLNKIKEVERSKFYGKKAGDIITFNVNDSFEDLGAFVAATGLTKEEVSEMSGDFEFVISTIKRRQLAEVNQDFYDRLFGKDVVTSDEAFNEKLKSTIEDNYKRESEALLSREIEQTLVEKTSIALPEEFLIDWMVYSNKGKVNKEEVQKQFVHFEKDLKWSLIRNKLIEANNIKAEHEEILAKAKEFILQQFGNMPVSEEMEETLNKIADNYLKQDNGKAYMQTFENVLLEKTVAFVKETIKIEDKNVSLEEFKKIVGAEN